jgi:hypothetical protein
MSLLIDVSVHAVTSRCRRSEEGAARQTGGMVSRQRSRRRRRTRRGLDRRVRLTAGWQGTPLLSEQLPQRASSAIVLLWRRRRIRYPVRQILRRGACPRAAKGSSGEQSSTSPRSEPGLVGRRPVDRRHLPAGHSYVNAQLAAVVDLIAEHEPHELKLR